MDVEDVVTKNSSRYIMEDPPDSKLVPAVDDMTSEIKIEYPEHNEDSESYEDHDKSASEIDDNDEDQDMIEEEVLDLSTKKHNGNGNVNYYSLNNNVRESGFTGDKDMEYDSDRSGSDELHIVENIVQADNDNDSDCDDESKDLQSSTTNMNMSTSPKFCSKEQEEYLKQLLRNHMRNYPVSVSQSQLQVPQQSRIGNTHKFVNMNNSTSRDFIETEIRSRASSHQSNFVPQNQTQRTQKDSRICANCSTDQTSLWRRTEDGQTVCNACGMYFRFHGRKRPLTLCASNNKILRRRRRRKDTDNNNKKSSTTTSTTTAIQSSKALARILPKKENGNGEILKTLLIFGSSNDQKESTTLGYNLNNNNNAKDSTTTSLDMSQISPSSSLDDNDSYSSHPLVIDNKFQHDRPSNNNSNCSTSTRNNNRNHIIIKTEIQKSDQTSEEEASNNGDDEDEYILPDLKVEEEN